MALFVIAGDSEALGYLNTGEAPYTPDPLTYIWDPQNKWFVQMQPGVNTGTPNNPTAWGPEVGIEQAFRADPAHAGEVLAIVKSVQGSTAVALDPNAVDWSPESHGEMFDLTTNMIAQARAAIGNPAVDGVFLDLGTNDGADAAKAAAFQPNLHDLDEHIRADWGATKIVLARVTDQPAFSEDVRVGAWSEDQADPNLSTFKTIGLGLGSDGIHFNAAGQLAQGQLFYDGWAAL